MSKKAQIKLSPLERATRNAVILFLYNAGYSVNAIARIMKMTQSTVSRVTDFTVGNDKLVDIIFGK